MDGRAQEVFPFEEYAEQNGETYWDAHVLMEKLGYSSWQSFSNVINKAMGSCVQLGIPILDTFRAADIIVDGRPRQTFRLTRFACFLIALHADDKKPQVAKAKVYFASLAESIIQHQIKSGDLERMELRQELKVGETMLSSVAAKHGLDPRHFGIFKDAGYRGMYNMSLGKLMEYKGVNRKETLYDYMGKSELAGNWFRVTQTVDRIRQYNLKGQTQLDDAAISVGREVRGMMIKNSGVAPENLPVEEHIKHVKSRLKSTNRGMKRIDRTSQISRQTESESANPEPSGL